MHMTQYQFDSIVKGLGLQALDFKTYKLLYNITCEWPFDLDDVVNKLNDYTWNGKYPMNYEELYDILIRLGDYEFLSLLSMLQKYDGSGERELASKIRLNGFDNTKAEVLTEYEEWMENDEEWP